MRLLHAAKEGDDSAIGELLQQCRGYLLLIASQESDKRLQAKIGSSDIVQETLLTAHQNFGQFHGSTKQELLAWLRKIVINDVYEAGRTFKKTKKRSLEREQQINRSSSCGPVLVDQNCTPKTNAIATEEAERLYSAISQLPKDYQQVIKLRNWQQQSFAAVGDEIGRSPEAARKLWTRAILRLEEILDS
jgi:RNA polymerase sigma-70 factor (ECF subfamily)